MPRPRSLRFHLLRLVLAGLIPTSLFAAGLMVLLWSQQRAELHHSLQDTARALSVAVDREVATSLQRLEVLGAQDSFREGRWGDFHRQSRRLVDAAEDWVNLLVFTASGEELLNTLTPWGEALPDYDIVGYVDRVVATRSPVVTDLFVSPTTGEQVVHVAIPILRGAEVVLVMAASLNLSGFDQLLVDQAVREEGVAAIYDRQLRFIGRSRDSQTHRGAQPALALLDAAQRDRSGVGLYPLVDREAIDVAWTRSELTGWTVSVGVPAAPVEASLCRSLLLLTSTGLLVLLATMLIALHLGRGLAGTVAQASASASALATGEPVAQPKSTIIELNVLGDALQRAGEVLRLKSEQRAEAEGERQLLFEREQLARSQAEAAGRAKDEFLALLGHELRNPLAPILFAVELAKSRPHEPPARALEVIERQAKHIVQLVDDLLDVARIVRGKIRLHKQVGELQPILSKAMEIAAPLFETQQHVLTIDVPKQGLLVEADETRIAQVVANLLTNAAKFTPPGGRVWLSARREADEVLIQVRDTGIGLSPELLPTIFESFTQGQRSHDQPHAGLGLGLALVRSFVQLHGGTVSVHSEGPGRGCEFTVRVPAAKPEQHPAKRPQQPLAGPDAQPRTRILVVDDNIDAADTLADLLLAHGHEVRTAYDGRRAVELARVFEPQVAIVDLGMPVMDGYEVAQELSRWAEHPYLIAVTGYGQEHDRLRSRDAGFDHHLVKPVTLAELLAALAEAG